MYSLALPFSYTSTRLRLLMKSTNIKLSLVLSIFSLLSVASLLVLKSPHNNHSPHISIFRFMSSLKKFSLTPLSCGSYTEVYHRFYLKGRHQNFTIRELTPLIDIFLCKNLEFNPTRIPLAVPTASKLSNSSILEPPKDFRKSELGSTLLDF